MLSTSFGSVWTWTAIDSDSRLTAAWLVGIRDSKYAEIFMENVASRLKNRVQLTTDGLKAYLDAIDENFGHDIDFAQLLNYMVSLPTKNIDIAMLNVTE